MMATLSSLHSVRNIIPADPKTIQIITLCVRAFRHPYSSNQKKITRVIISYNTFL